MSQENQSIPAADNLIARRSDNGRVQPLAEHLRNTAKKAGDFAKAFGARNWGLAAGLLHDDGKAVEAFQRRVRGANIRVDHSTAGAKYAYNSMTAPKGSGKLLAYCIAGHHAGLADGSSGDDESCLSKRLARAQAGPGYLADELPSTLEAPPIEKPPIGAERSSFSAAFFTRMVYSCLVDADYLDTESFADQQKGRKREAGPALEQLKTKLERHLARLMAEAAPTDVNRLRAKILKECRAAAGLDPGR